MLKCHTASEKHNTSKMYEVREDWMQLDIVIYVKACKRNYVIQFSRRTHLKAKANRSRNIGEPDLHCQSKRERISIMKHKADCIYNIDSS